MQVEVNYDQLSPLETMENFAETRLRRFMDPQARVRIKLAVDPDGLTRAEVSWPGQDGTNRTALGRDPLLWQALRNGIDNAARQIQQARSRCEARPQADKSPQRVHLLHQNSVELQPLLSLVEETILRLKFVRGDPQRIQDLLRLTRWLKKCLASGVAQKPLEQTHKEVAEFSGRLADEIKGWKSSGVLPSLARLQRQTPNELRELLAIEGLGWQRLRRIYRHLSIQNREDLRQAAIAGRLTYVPGISQYIQLNIMRQLRGRLAEESGPVWKIA